MADEPDIAQVNDGDTGLSATGNQSESEQPEPDDFDEIAAVKDSILEGVITYW